MRTPILASALLLALGVLPAVETAGDKPRHGGKEAVYDTNHDGKLDDQERAARRAALAAKLKSEHPELFKKLDTNGDGALSEDEMKAGREQLKALKAEADTNHDGTVDAAERKAMHAAMAAKIKAEHPDLFKQLDTNGDGTLSEDEIKAGKEQIKALRHKNMDKKNKS